MLSITGSVRIGESTTRLSTHYSAERQMPKGTGATEGVGNRDLPIIG